MYNMKNAYSFWDLLKIPFNSLLVVVYVYF